MVDNLTKNTRSQLMSKIRSSKTKPELIIKGAIRGKGYSYQPKMEGNPDFVNKKNKIVIFVHGCFWHGCNEHLRLPASNRMYWVNKIKRNVERDKENEKMLEKEGYKIVRIWEHDFSNLDKVLKKIK